MGRGEGFGGSQSRPDLVQVELVQESIVVQRASVVQVCVHYLCTSMYTYLCKGYLGGLGTNKPKTNVYILICGEMLRRALESGTSD